MLEQNLLKNRYAFCVISFILLISFQNCKTNKRLYDSEKVVEYCKFLHEVKNYLKTTQPITQATLDQLQDSLDIQKTKLIGLSLNDLQNNCDFTWNADNNVKTRTTIMVYHDSINRVYISHDYDENMEVLKNIFCSRTKEQSIKLH